MEDVKAQELFYWRGCDQSRGNEVRRGKAVGERVDSVQNEVDQKSCILVVSTEPLRLCWLGDRI